MVIASASRAVQRTGDNQKVFRYDFAEEIHWVRVAKDKVGSSSSTEKQFHVKETVMRPDELSPELLEKYEKIVPTNNIASEN